MNNPETLAAYGIQNTIQDKQNKDTQYVLDTTMRRQKQIT